MKARLSPAPCQPQARTRGDAAQQRGHGGRRGARSLGRLHQAAQLAQAGRHLHAIRGQVGVKVGGQQLERRGTAAKRVGIGGQRGAQAGAEPPRLCQSLAVVDAVGGIRRARAARTEKQVAGELPAVHRRKRQQRGCRRCRRGHAQGAARAVLSRLTVGGVRAGPCQGLQLEGWNDFGRWALVAVSRGAGGRQQPLLVAGRRAPSLRGPRRKLPSPTQRLRCRARWIGA